jgi:hypothetical protein
MAKIDRGRIVQGYRHPRDRNGLFRALNTFAQLSSKIQKKGPNLIRAINSFFTQPLMDQWEEFRCLRNSTLRSPP